MSNEGKKLEDHLAQSYMAARQGKQEGVSERPSTIASAMGQFIPAGDHQCSQGTRANSALIGHIQ